MKSAEGEVPDWKELERKYLMRTYVRAPVVLVRGEGARVWDEEGREYLDFVGGIAVNVLGHCHPAVVETIKEQAQTLIHASNLYYTIPQIKLARLLVEHSPFDKVFFCNSGAEAVEGAIKLARKYGKMHLEGAYEIITAENSFHGRTLAALAATGQPELQKPFEPLPEGFRRVEYGDIEAIKRATTRKTCGVMLEPIQGEGGVIVPPPNYLKEVREWCDERGILLILDEVQTGMGRLGKLFGFELYGITPDIATLAKGLGGGFPIGAILAKEKASVFAPRDHASTFGGNPLACAAAYAALKFIIENDIPEKAKRAGERLRRKLRELAQGEGHIREVRGEGLLVGVEFDEDVAPKLSEICLKKGLLVNPVRPKVIRLAPPLIVREREIDEAVEKIREAMREIWR